MNDLDDAALGAYIDGQLDEPERKLMAERIAGDPMSALRLARMRAADDLLRQAFPEPDTGEEDALAEKILSGDGKRGPRPIVAWRAIAAAVACAAIGVGIGRLSVPTTSITRDPSLGMVATGELARRLDHQASGGRLGEPRILLSFRTPAGRTCRQFSAVDGMDGVSCRQNERWAILAVQPSKSSATSGYRAASGGESSAIEAAIDDLGAITVLEPNQERQALARHWR